MEHKSSEKISEALKLLEEAAIQKKDELKGVIADKYEHLAKVFVDAESSLVKSLSSAGHHAVDAAAHARDVSVEKVCDLARDADKSVHHNPWPYLAGTAVVGTMFGFMLGRSRK